MKRIWNKSFLVLAVASVTLGGCKKSIDDFGNTNINPNATTVPITSALLTNVLSQLGNNVWSNGTNINGGLYAQYMSETQYTDASRYATPTLNEDGYYSGPLYDLQNIINVNSDPETADAVAVNGSNANQIATARILKAYYFWVLTDAYGDLPYFEALKGEGIVAYDSQEAIYNDILKELKEAATQFDGGAPFAGDILFGGDTGAWSRFANSLRALVALRLSKVNPSLGQTEFSSALSAGVIDDNSENAMINYPGGAYPNPVYNYYGLTQRFDYAVSSTLADELSDLNDPRLDLYASNPKGFPYGLTRADAIAWANANPVYGFLYDYDQTPETMPMYVLTAGQMYLARAEAAELGWITESAAADYAAGITAEMNRWGITNAGAIAAYLAQPAVALTGANNMEKIITQQWLAFYPDGNQAWAIWRKTGYPVLSPAPGAGKPIPLRLPYGQNDQLYNPDNYAQAAARYTANGVADSQDAALWWDK